MPTAEPANAREKLLAAGIDLFRRGGYGATTVDQICAAANVTKGAFFHHFASKEVLAQQCLAGWQRWGESMEAAAPFQTLTDPVERLLGYMDFFIAMFSDPKLFKSCLAGTAAQEVSESHPALRQAAHDCLASGQQRFKALLDEAGKKSRRRFDTASLAALWMASLQGALVLAKASHDETIIPQTLQHVREYLRVLYTARG